MISYKPGICFLPLYCQKHSITIHLFNYDFLPTDAIIDNLFGNRDPWYQQLMMSMLLINLSYSRNFPHLLLLKLFNYLTQLSLFLGFSYDKFYCLKGDFDYIWQLYTLRNLILSDSVT